MEKRGSTGSMSLIPPEGVSFYGEDPKNARKFSVAECWEHSNVPMRLGSPKLAPLERTPPTPKTSESVSANGGSQENTPPASQLTPLGSVLDASSMKCFLAHEHSESFHPNGDKVGNSNSAASQRRPSLSGSSPTIALPQRAAGRGQTASAAGSPGGGGGGSQVGGGGGGGGLPRHRAQSLALGELVGGGGGGGALGAPPAAAAAAAEKAEGALTPPRRLEPLVRSDPQPRRTRSGVQSTPVAAGGLPPPSAHRRHSETAIPSPAESAGASPRRPPPGGDGGQAAAAYLGWELVAGIKRGRRPWACQDRLVLAVPARGPGGDARRALVGVCDGHGPNGHLAAEFCALNIYSSVKKGGLDKADEMHLRKAVVSLHQELVASGDDYSLSGTTLCCALFSMKDNSLKVINAGDSRCCLIQNEFLPGDPTTYNIVQLSTDHKPNNVLERNRIESKGGIVDRCHERDKNRVNGDRRLSVNGLPHRVWRPLGDGPGLAMSRSLGDVEATAVGVTPDPEVTEHHICERDQFLICASDGIWDVFTNQQVLEYLLTHIRSKVAPMKMAQLLCKTAQRKWLESKSMTDDISCVILNIPELAAHSEKLEKEKHQNKGNRDQTNGQAQQDGGHKLDSLGHSTSSSSAHRGPARARSSGSDFSAANNGSLLDISRAAAGEWLAGAAAAPPGDDLSDSSPEPREERGAGRRRRRRARPAPVAPLPAVAAPTVGGGGGGGRRQPDRRRRGSSPAAAAGRHAPPPHRPAEGSRNRGPSPRAGAGGGGGGGARRRGSDPQVLWAPSPKGGGAGRLRQRSLTAGGGGGGGGGVQQGGGERAVRVAAPAAVEIIAAGGGAQALSPVHHRDLGLLGQGLIPTRTPTAAGSGGMNMNYSSLSLPRAAPRRSSRSRSTSKHTVMLDST